MPMTSPLPGSKQADRARLAARIRALALELGFQRCGISGIELARKVRDRFPELPILLTTGYSEEVGGTHGFPVLQKPYELNSLADALSKMLRREIVLS